MAPSAPQSPPEDPAEPAVPFSLIVGVWSIVALGVIALLYFARAFFIPLLLGLTLAYVLRPAVDLMVGARAPRGLAALAVILVVLAALGGGAYALSDDVSRLLETLPKAAREVRVALQDSRSAKPTAITQVRETARELDKAAAAASGQAPTAPPAATPSLGSRLQDYAVAQGVAVIFTLGQALFVFLLTWFVLSEGDTFKRKLLKMVGPSFERKKITVRILDDIDTQVQRQMGTMFVVNLLIGVSTGIAFSMMGLEQALLWGVVAGVLHFIPYVGQATVTALSSAAAYLQFGTFASAMSVGAVTLALSFAIGTVLMTFMQSRASRVNATVLFVAVLFFGWLWGGWGLVLASPIVAMVKSVCDNVEAFAPAREFMSGNKPEARPPAPVPAD
jgi:predicted PurR-regulated permease PerM